MSFIPTTPQPVAVTLCALGIVGLFFAPRIKRSAINGFVCYERDVVACTLWLIPILALATLFRQNTPVGHEWLGARKAKSDERSNPVIQNQSALKPF